MNDSLDELRYLEKIIDFEGGIDRGPISEKEILIYSPEKTGTVSLYHSIGAYCANMLSWDDYERKMFHNHSNRSVLRNIKIASPEINYRFLVKRQIVQDLLEYKRLLGQQLIIVTSFREPTNRTISNTFQLIENQVSIDRTKNITDFNLKKCTKLFYLLSDFKKFKHPLEEIEPEFFKEEEFDKDKKCLLVNRGHYKILVVCLEHSSRWKNILESELKFDDINLQIRNQAKSKEIANLYTEFKNSLTLPKSFIRRIYYQSSYTKYLNWFYTKDEINQFYQDCLSLYGQNETHSLPFLPLAKAIRFIEWHTIGPLFKAKNAAIRALVGFLRSSPRIKSALFQIIKHFPHLASKLIGYTQDSLHMHDKSTRHGNFDDKSNYQPETARLPELDELIINRIHSLRVKSENEGKSSSYTTHNRNHILNSLGNEKNGANKIRPTMAYISPMPPVPSGISYYSREILPALSKHYEITVIIQQENTTDKNFTLRDLAWFKDNYATFDRVIYHIGNSGWHSHMVDIFDQYPGIIILHDVYLGHMLREMGDATFDHQLYLSHGYSSLKYKMLNDINAAIWKYPISCSLSKHSYGVIVHSEYAAEQLRKSCDIADQIQIAATPLANILPDIDSRDAARDRLNLPKDRFIACCFGVLGPTKLNDRLLLAWSNLSSAERDSALLIFVGGFSESYYIQVLSPLLETKNVRPSVKFPNHVTESQYQDYLLATDIAVQLRSQSRGESSRSILECMSYGLPTIINNHGSNNELPADCLIKIPDNFTDRELQTKLSACISGDEGIYPLAKKARQFIEKSRTPEIISQSYRANIEMMYEQAAISQITKLMEATEFLENKSSWNNRLTDTINGLASSTFRQNPTTVYTDISELIKHHRETGIQRVAQNVIEHSLDILNEKNVRLEPIYMHNKRYYLARRYMFNKYGANCEMALDMPVRFSEGDIFLGLDFTINQHPYLADVLTEARKQGAKVYLLLYDLLPIALPSTFYKEVVVNFKLWLEAAVSVADGMICISKTVADELLVWLKNNPPKRSTPLDVGYFHLGSCLSEQELSKRQLFSQPTGLLKNNSRQTVLMVGTIEPRKGYAQVLSAFDLIWKADFDVNLVIVGREGWLVDDLVDNMTHHPEYNKRLYWLNDADDTALDELYQHSTVLLAASEGEGFGLPIVEAARRGTPAILRDIPVFREVAGDGGFYFTGKSAEHLADKVQEWFSLHATEKTPKPQLIKTVSWQESSSQLYEIILHGNWYQRWSDL